MSLISNGYQFCGSRTQQQQNKRGGGKISFPNFFVATNITKTCKEKNLSRFTKNYSTFYPKIVTKLLKIWVWDPGSGIQKKKLFRTPDPWVKKAPDPGSGSATLPVINLYFRIYSRILVKQSKWLQSGIQDHGGNYCNL